MLQVLPFEFGAEDADRAGSGRLRLLIHDHRRVQRLRLEPGREATGGGHVGRAAPDRLRIDLPGRLGQGIFRFRQHADEHAVVDDLDDAVQCRQVIQQRRQRRLVHFRLQRLRPEHLPEAHAGQHHVVDVLELAEHLVGDVGAALPAQCRRAAATRLQVRRVDVRGQNVRIDQFVIARLEPAAFDEEDAVLQMDGAGARGELFGTTDAARFAQVRGGVAQGSAGVLDRQAAGSHGLVGAGRGRRPHHLHLPDLQLQFFGHDQPQRMRDALADVDLAGVRANASVRRHVQPLAQARMDLQVLGDGGGVHSQALFTARTTRLCTPQRHRLPSSACWMSSSDGCGLRLSSAAAVIRIPLVQ